MLVFGTIEWIDKYLSENGFSFGYDYHQGEPFIEVDMTRGEFKRMEKAADALRDGTYVAVFFDSDLGIKNTVVTYLARFKRKICHH